MALWNWRHCTGKERHQLLWSKNKVLKRQVPWCFLPFSNPTQKAKEEHLFLPPFLIKIKNLSLFLYEMKVLALLIGQRIRTSLSCFVFCAYHPSTITWAIQSEDFLIGSEELIERQILGGSRRSEILQSSHRPGISGGSRRQGISCRSLRWHAEIVINWGEFIPRDTLTFLITTHLWNRLELTLVFVIRKQFVFL